MFGDGFIPAHAGKTDGHGGAASALRAHPRSRGENDVSACRVKLDPGSSPLTRGKLRDAAQPGSTHGLIPAHAGKTDTGGVSTYGHGAHPRSRGENPELLEHGPPAAGLIPAHAGKTLLLASSRTRRRAHPRSRGENSFARPLKARENGSSPLTRGKRGRREPTR